MKNETEHGPTLQEPIDDARLCRRPPTATPLSMRSKACKLPIAPATGEGIFTALQAISTVGAVIGGGDTPAGADRAVFRRQRDPAVQPRQP